jgi:hypothetical protein
MPPEIEPAACPQDVVMTILGKALFTGARRGGIKARNSRSERDS